MSVRRLAVSTVVLLVAATTFLLPASSQERAEHDISEDLEAARQQEQEVRELLNELSAATNDAEEELAITTTRLEDAEIRLASAEAQVQVAEVGLREAENTRDDARDAHHQAEMRLVRTEREFEHNQDVLHTQVRHMYRHGTTAGTQYGQGMIHLLMNAQNPNDLAVGMKQLNDVTDAQTDVVETVIELVVQYGEQEEEADELRLDALAAAREARDYLAEVEQLRAVAQEVAEQVEDEKLQQEALLAQLRSEQQDLTQVMERVEVRQEELNQELAARRAVVRGAGGGPDVPGGHCPVEGAVVGQDFINDWGFPRSGGRRHQGNDMFAAEGTPIVAIEDGTVVRMNPVSAPTALGGVTVTYKTASGDQWYNAHLLSITPGLSVGDTVEAGEEIGTVGRTGNARTTPPHNHIQRLHSGSWVNPYPTIALLCQG